MTTPSGTSTNFVMPAAAAAKFADPVDAYFGIQPNQTGNIGQSAILSRVQITGVPVPLDESFSGDTLNIAKLQVVAADATGVIQVPPTAAYWLKWTAPATGYVLQSSTDLKPGSWVNADFGTVVQIGPQKMVMVPTAKLPSARASFFRLLKQ